MRLPSDLLTECVIVAGPTAVGKSALSMELAGLLNAEILSLDSMAIYRHLDIGTAKPTAADRERVPHHLIDLIEPHEDFSVAEYLQATESAIRDVRSRGRVPLFVGGTGLYLRALLRGVFEGPAADWDLRKRLERDAETDPSSLHDRLRAVDPQSAEKLHPNDLRRVIRAIEVFETTGRPISEQQAEPALPPDRRPRLTCWLSPPREWLYDRIDRRVDLMIEQGLVDETRTLLERGQVFSRTARQALGYREVLAHLERNEPLDRQIELIKTRTRQFAKRQHTWFRNLEECTACEITGEEMPIELAKRLVESA